MGLNPIKASREIVDKYLGYINTTFYINDMEYRNMFEETLKEKSFFAKGPYIDFVDSFKVGKSLEDLIQKKVVSKNFRKLFKSKENLLKRKLYKHQEQSIIKANENKNLVITTGTGSGKTESFLYPILNYLMNEEENQRLDDGVRALLIYPMNALANDQMKRMRELLKDYPEITFGLYTGETENLEKRARDKYIQLNESEPLKNERISRDEMKKRPPHILITNYAMLEYLMIRPQDNVFFYGSKANKWKYIVLDEAHTYIGASGIEVSMLLRRVKNILEENKKINFMLTSATLGEKKDVQAICDFAYNLCGEVEFEKDSIIMADRHKFDNAANEKYNLDLYKELAKLINNREEEIEEYRGVLKKYNVESLGKNFKEILFEVIQNDENYYNIRKMLLEEPKQISEIAETLKLNVDEVVNFIFVASNAEKKAVKLLEAKYHMFIRMLEGIYITLPPYKSLKIYPTKKIILNNIERVAYNIAVCKYCGQIYIKGYIEESILKQSKERNINDKIYALLTKDQKEKLSEKEVEKVLKICSVCGHVEESSKIKQSLCNCGKENLTEILEIDMKNDEFKKCIECGINSIQGSVVREFYLGQEATSSVVCSALYEELPKIKEEVIKKEAISDDYEDDFLGISPRKIEQKNILKSRVQKQLLVFSDSRQEAAYFSSYFNFTYTHLLKRRLIVEAIREMKGSIREEGIDVEVLVSKLKEMYIRNDIYKEAEVEKEAWKTVLYELTCSDRNSLENIGIISFEYNAENYGKVGQFINEECIVVQKVLANSFRKAGAIKTPIDEQLTKADREDYLFNGYVTRMCLNGLEKERNGVLSWIPADKKGNSRTFYLGKTYINERRNQDVFLKNIWMKIYNEKKELEMQKASEYLMRIEAFKVKPSKSIFGFGAELKWYKCKKCGKLTVNNIKDICPQGKCCGKLIEVKKEEFNKYNHYRNQYLNMDIAAMKIKEHTAQLSPKKAQEYQKEFVEKRLNILSCSTTFEMGVDVGDLETVFMKNVPPTPANYVQRAGRAGRHSNSVAYALTLCKLASHDLTYFNNPVKMVRGKIKPPKFKIENEKIVKRHVNAIILANFWRVHQDRYNDVRTFFEKNNFELLMNYIKVLSKEIKDYIKIAVPARLKDKVDIWINELGDEEGILYREFNEYTKEIQELEFLREELFNKNIEVGIQVIRIEKYIRTIKDEKILQFLARKNVFPKYGFPVDTVELTTSLSNSAIEGFDKTSKLRLQRDLMVAIADYAPGSEVIADGKIYTSKFIKKPNGNKILLEYDYGICEEENCKHMNIKLQTEENTKVIGLCQACGKEVNRLGSFLIPEYGFIIDSNIRDAKTKKPQKTYLSEINYIGNPKVDAIVKVYELNGMEIKIKSTEDDELLIINTSEFLVCPKCGYSEVKSKQKISSIREHKNPYGKKCEIELLKIKKLGHKLKTDVVQIAIGKYINIDEARSILYALLEGVSEYLEIERKDIAGCLDYRKLSNGEFETIFVLFDTVPGGAGHTRRIGKFNNEELRKLLKKSLNIVGQCKCGGQEGEGACYSCLCNYSNQRYHEKLKRKYAIDFLEDVLGRF